MAEAFSSTKHYKYFEVFFGISIWMWGKIIILLHWTFNLKDLFKKKVNGITSAMYWLLMCYHFFLISKYKKKKLSETFGCSACLLEMLVEVDKNQSKHHIKIKNIYIRCSHKSTHRFLLNLICKWGFKGKCM